MHALHGNGRGRRGGGTGRPAGGSAAEPWRTVGSSLLARDLMVEQPVGKLRAAGWRLPEDVVDDSLLRVYDARLDAGWMLQLLPELGLDAGKVFTIGGDFLTAPFRVDEAALQERRMVRWGPDGTEPYHLVVPPRPHVEKWLRRARLQLPVELAGTWVSVAMIVPREACPEVWSAAGVRRALPQVALLLDDPALEVRVAAVGERAHVVRVPADAKELPLPQWKAGLLVRDRVLVFVSFRLFAGVERPPLQHCWLRGQPPPLPREELELLRLEYVLPPATKAESGERMLRAAVRKVAVLLGLGAGPPLQLRQVQPAQGVMYALLGVPPTTARRWLWSSGHGGLFVRPFWTPASGAAVARDQFEMIWVKCKLESAPKLWEAVNGVRGFFGLYADGRDIGIRVSADVDRAAIKAQVEFVLGGATSLKSVEPGVRWWVLTHLTLAEMYRVQDMIASTGLRLARAELRVAEFGPFRRSVFFTASGQPSKTLLDNGGWIGSEAKLFPADPPPPRKKNAALPPQSTWGGPRPAAVPTVPQPSPAPAVAPVSVAPTAPSGFPIPASLATPSVWTPADPGHGGFRASVSPPAAAGGFPVVSSTEFPELPSSSGGGGRRNRRGGAAGAPREADMLAALLAQVAGLQSTLAAIQEELKESRRENALLRQQLDFARGVRSHQPYALPPLPDPPPVFTPPRPSSESLMRTADQLSPFRPGVPDLADHVGDQVMSGSPPAAAVETKRARRALSVPPGAAVSVISDAASASSSLTPSGAVPPHVE